MDIVFTLVPFVIIGGIFVAFRYILKYAKKAQEEKEKVLNEKIDTILQHNPEATSIAGVSWKPLKGGGVNYVTRKLVETSGFRVEFVPTFLSRVLYLFFVIFPLLFVVGPIYDLLKNGVDAIFENIFVLMIQMAILLLFLVVTVRAFVKSSQNIIFDKSKGVYWKGNGDLPVEYVSDVSKDFVLLRDIKAIQIIKETVSGNNKSFISYELNVVLADKSRANIVDHSGEKQIKEDAKVLAQFLNVPVWDLDEIMNTPTSEPHPHQSSIL
jgi:ABC-type multidrug transport system fused ATPase/permease subunit